MSFADSSFVVPPSNSSDDDVDSLPSEATTDSLDYDENEAEREWRESLQQLELLLTMVVVPYLGKYFGRKCAYWGVWYTTVSLYFVMTNPTSYRLGQIHGVEISRRGPNHQPHRVQGRRSRRGRCIPIDMPFGDSKRTDFVPKTDSLA